eukprot:CAMPEP_0170496218 /NCGR_PEP_ID=MMETSP0208-20121228/20762_1 /TAXON_ID=197538 /ORGANISM="Strombidium inclinatum, Strain S3" /LENGTH=42 /DNA_ID= /DNA_START= /DNA_END= /DNA_ORIENTATION=
MDFSQLKQLQERVKKVWDENIGYSGPLEPEKNNNPGLNPTEL